MISLCKLSSVGLLRTARVIHEEASMKQHQICARKITQRKSALSEAGTVELSREGELMRGGGIPPEGLERWGNALTRIGNGHCVAVLMAKGSCGRQ